MSTPTPTTITVYAHVEYRDADGMHAINESRVLPYQTDAEVAEVQTLVAYGVVGTSPKGAQRTTA